MDLWIWTLRTEYNLESQSYTQESQDEYFSRNFDLNFLSLLCQLPTLAINPIRTHIFRVLSWRARKEESERRWSEEKGSFLEMLLLLIDGELRRKTDEAHIASTKQGYESISHMMMKLKWEVVFFVIILEKFSSHSAFACRASYASVLGIINENHEAYFIIIFAQLSPLQHFFHHSSEVEDGKGRESSIERNWAGLFGCKLSSDAIKSRRPLNAPADGKEWVGQGNRWKDSLYVIKSFLFRQASLPKLYDKLAIMTSIGCSYRFALMRLFLHYWCLVTNSSTRSLAQKQQRKTPS